MVINLTNSHHSRRGLRYIDIPEHIRVYRVYSGQNRMMEDMLIHSLTILDSRAVVVLVCKHKSQSIDTHTSWSSQDVGS